MIRFFVFWISLQRYGTFSFVLISFADKICFYLSFLLLFHLINLLDKLGFCGQIQLILAGQHGVVVLWKSHAHNCIVLSGAKQDAYRGILFWQFLASVIVVDIHLQLSQVLMGQLSCLYLDNNKAFQQSVVEHQVGEELVIFK